VRRIGAGRTGHGSLPLLRLAKHFPTCRQVMPTSSLSGIQSPCFHPALGERCSVIGAGACDVGNDATVEVTRQTTAQSQPTNTEQVVSEPNMGSLWGSLPRQLPAPGVSVSLVAPDPASRRGQSRPTTSCQVLGRPASLMHMSQSNMVGR
jgi:hypothetical protein